MSITKTGQIRENKAISGDILREDAIDCIHAAVGSISADQFESVAGDAGVSDVQDDKHRRTDNKLGGGSMAGESGRNVCTGGDCKIEMVVPPEIANLGVRDEGLIEKAVGHSYSQMLANRLQNYLNIVKGRKRSRN